MYPRQPAQYLVIDDKMAATIEIGGNGRNRERGSGKMRPRRDIVK